VDLDLLGAFGITVKSKGQSRNPPDFRTGGLMFRPWPVSPQSIAHRNTVHHLPYGPVSQSVCNLCFSTIAYSPRPDLLPIAENVHRCPCPPPREVRHRGRL
jgi:hypothetical protein